MNSLIQKLKSINSKNLILYNHTSRKLIKKKNKLKTKFNFYFKEIAFEILYYFTTREARYSLQAIMILFTILQFKSMLFYLYSYDQKIPFMTYYVADELEKYDTENIKMIDVDELNSKKLKYAFEIKYY
jgi:hypothetical protein